jgi:hypothetical protein
VISYTTPGPGSQNTGAHISHATEKSRGAATILGAVDHFSEHPLIVAVAIWRLHSSAQRKGMMSVIAMLRQPAPFLDVRHSHCSILVPNPAYK